jgi:hypothetical protein
MLAAVRRQTYPSSAVHVEITPEPTPDEREALVRGLEGLLAGRGSTVPPAYRSPWREAGIREALGAFKAAREYEP